MDIFNRKKETPQQRVEKVAQAYGVEQTQGKDMDQDQIKLDQAYKAQCQKLNDFIKEEYQLLDFKVNRCTLKCYKNAQNTKEMAQCRSKCQAGSKNLSLFVSNRVDDITNRLNLCLEKSQAPNKSKYHEAVKCYQDTIDYFKIVRAQIREEALFYQ